MAKRERKKIHRSGAYVVKAAESRPSRVASKKQGQSTAPTGADRQLARALLKTKRA